MDHNSSPQNESDLELLAGAGRNIPLLSQLNSLATTGAQLVLLLHLLPNLRFLKLNPFLVPGVFDRFLEQCALLPNEALPLGLRSLRDINLGRSYHVTTPKGLLTLFNLPSIRKIQLGAVGEICQFDLIPTAHSAQSSVTHLCFGLSTVSTQELGRILPMMRALKYFTYSAEHGAIDAAAFGLALKACRATLQQLRLSLSYGIHAPYGLTYTDGTIGSLRDWPVLKSLRCPLWVLLGQMPSHATTRLVDVLPTVTKDFRIDVDPCWADWQIVEQVVQVMELKKCGGFGGLTRVTIRRMNKLEDQKLIAACKAADVRFRRC